MPANQPASNPLLVEALEPRCLLSTVTIEATGMTGEENLVVSANGQQLLSEIVSDSGNAYTFDIANELTVNDLKIEFTNDFFESGVKDRNLVIDRFNVDGVDFDLSADNVFSTGTWRVGDGVQPGYGRGNILHSNGFIQIEATDSSSQQVEFNGITWQVSRLFSEAQISIDPQYNELVIRAFDREVAVYRQVEIEPGSFARLSVDGWRNEIAGSVDNSSAGAGIDFFDSQGNQVFPFPSFELNANATNPADRIQTLDFEIPDAATTAYLWVWVDGTSAANDVSLRLTDLRLETIDTSVDLQPPIVSLSSTEVSPFGRDAFFSLRIEDDLRLPDPIENVERLQNGIQLIDPIGQVITPVPASFSQDAPNFLGISFRINREFGEASSLIRGEYEVRLLDGIVADANGNFASAQTVGVFELRDPFSA